MSPSLKAVDFDPTEDPAVSGLVRLHQKHPPLSLDEEAVVREAESIKIDQGKGLDYVFFRRFSDVRSSQVAAYIIDNSDERYDKIALAELHKEVWLNGRAPLLYVSWPTSVDILSCARGSDFWQANQEQGNYDYNPAETIQLEAQSDSGLLFISSEVSEALEEKCRRFSAQRLADGTFWDEPLNSEFADADKAAHRCLIQAVIEADQALNGKDHPVLRRLLLLTVLIKYLEDRGVFEQEKDWFGQFHTGATNFFDVLKAGTPIELKSLLNSLESKFNGDVFCLPAEGADNLTSSELRRVFATLVESKSLGQQRYLWNPYSFQHLPVEVLSHLYQHFAQHGKGAIYTPPFVASLLLDFALPYDRISGNERVLDPTCGSGVFLVGAFRRLVNHWRSVNKWQQPDVATLKKILNRSIFGVELQEESLHLAAFSLALAVCDALKPNVIWNKLQFDKLVGKNLIQGDFFDFVEQKHKPFDVVLGNPPFSLELTEAGKRVNKAAEKTRSTLPDKQVAYLIAEQALTLLNKGGHVCLIQPAGLFYNESPRRFQSDLLSAYQTNYVLDFTSVRSLFNKADTKIVVFVCTKTAPLPEHNIRHLTFRRTFSVKEQIGFELDHYDYHRVPQQQALDTPNIWKINLLGGGRLYHIATRLKKMGTLLEFVDGKKWEYGEGYIAAKKGRRSEEPWLTGKPLLPSVALTDSGINERLLRNKYVKDTLFRSAYSEERYSSPLMLIRANEKLQCGFWDQGFLAYKDKVVGIHAPNQPHELLQFFNDFCDARPILQALCLIESTQLLVGRATAPLKRDIDNLPWPKNGKSWDLAPWERVMCSDLVEYMADYTRRGQNSALLKQKANDADLKRYADCYCEMLGSVYHNLKTGRSVSLNGLICQSFYFGDEPQLDWPEKWEEPLQKLIYVQWGDTIRTTRMVRYYEKNVVLLVKPDRLRYWIPSTAIRDADETLVDLTNQGY